MALTRAQRRFHGSLSYGLAAFSLLAYTLKLYHHVLWFDAFLRRTTTVTQQDKERIWQAMEEFGSLLDEGYFVQKRVAEAEARGKALGEAVGEARGEARGLQEALVSVIELRFPSLLDKAQQKVGHVEKPEALKLLVQGIKKAPDEESARFLLDLLEAA